MANLDKYVQNPDTWQIYPSYGGNNQPLARGNNNASPFDPLSYQSDKNLSVQQNEKVLGKDKQNLYQDQLDVMLLQNNTKTEKTIGDDYQKIGAKYEQDQYNRYDTYENNNQLANERQFQLSRNRGRSVGHLHQPQGIDQKGLHPQMRNYTDLNQEEIENFTQQETQNDQKKLLSKLKNGYRQQNIAIWNMYHKAYEDKEKAMQDLERNVVEKAARERLIKEEQRYRAEHERKQKMEKDTFISNKKALENMTSEKMKQKVYEKVLENQRIQDALTRFEREERLKKEWLEKMKRENNMILDIQKRDMNSRKSRNNTRTGVRLSYDPQMNSVEQYDGIQREEVIESPMKNYEFNMYQPHLKERPDVYRSQANAVVSKTVDLGLKEAHGKLDDNVDKYIKEQNVSGRNSQELKQRPVLEYKRGADYQSIRDKIRFGAPYNIITNEKKIN